ncbi:MAG: UDP-N-acetylglucosamine 1-carboxyvinyltransferase, partial [Flavobacteriales bacterium]|nr:UDP-N-acetylglucosamine 1-carboxyvinyltransferase [Flavobacteriales bacterium]
MNTFQIEGGVKLKGEITPQGAKNEALQVLCAVLLTPEKVTISNIPDILDVNKLIDILSDLGVKIQKTAPGEYVFQADEINLAFLESDEFKKKGSGIRGSIMIVGPLLARFGKGFIPKPGGDKIGRRRLDTHFDGFKNLGATFRYNEEESFYGVEADKLVGTYMLLDEASVTGTANILMAAILAEGTTTIYNAASEPYIQQLSTLLIKMGAKISGIGSNLLTIEGVNKEDLKGASHRILPDMIEIGSYIGMAALTKSEITIKDVNWNKLGLIPNVFRKLGIQLEKRGDDIFIPSQESYEIQGDIDGSILTISDAPWPGFTPDLLSIVLVVATQAKGSVLIHQKMF